MKKTISILVGIVVLVAVVAAALFLKGPNLEATADNIVAELNAGNYEAVYNDSLLPFTYGLEDFAGRMGIGFEYDVTKGEKVAWTGTGELYIEKYIYGDFKYPNGETDVVTFWFVEKDGDLTLRDVTFEVHEEDTSE